VAHEEVQLLAALSLIAAALDTVVIAVTEGFTQTKKPGFGKITRFDYRIFTFLFYHFAVIYERG